MSLQVENLEKSMAKLTIETSEADFDAAVEKAYQKNKNKISLPGFRKGKAPRKMIEKMYGAEVFFEDAANIIIPDAYEAAAKESGLEIVSMPKVDVVQLEAGIPFIFTAEVAVKPEVTLGDYKGIEVEKADLTVTEEELNEEFDKVRNQQARTITVEDRAVQDGDIAVIDFEGFMDGVAFEGGQGKDFPLTIGSHSFIDNFEEQLIGKNVNEEVEVNVTFPEQYQAEELAGKPAMFKVTIKEIKCKELPELDDELAQDISDFETFEEYKADVEKKIAERKEEAAKTAKEDQVIQKIIENATMEIPEPMIEEQCREMAQDFSRRIQSQGLTLEQYFQFTGMDASRFLEQMKPQALKRIQSRLVLEAVVKAENIEASEEDMDKAIEEMATAYGMKAEDVKERIVNEQLDLFKLDLAVQKAVDFVVDASVEVEKAVEDEKAVEE